MAVAAITAGSDERVEVPGAPAGGARAAATTTGVEAEVEAEEGEEEGDAGLYAGMQQAAYEKEEEEYY